jgi:hypothetical protein
MTPPTRTSHLDPATAFTGPIELSVWIDGTAALTFTLTTGETYRFYGETVITPPRLRKATA